MQSTRRSNAERGFSFIELLIATSVMLAALATAGAFFATSRRSVQDQILRIETLQGLRAAMDSMVRDLRLGGACLPVTGDFITLDSTHTTATEIFTRTGLVRPNETCVRTIITQDINAGDTTLPVESASGFSAGMRAYIRNSNGASGEVFTLTGVDTGVNTLQKATTLSCGGSCNSPAYPSGSGVYAVDERYYAVDNSNPSLPVLTLGVNGNAPVPFAFGIESIKLQYELEENCDSAAGCTVVDQPANDTEFALVNQIYITLTARSQTVGSNGQYYRVTRTVTAKPRNLLPAG
jgi:type II secretory pathway pseudopilin PulG